MKPQEYRHDNGISVLKIKRCVAAAGYHGYSRPIHSAVENGAKTGVTLCSDAAKAVKAKFPEYYATLPFVEKPKKRDSNRKLKNRFCFRTSDEFAQRMQKAKEALCYSTTQDFILFALDMFMQGIEKAAPDAGTSKAANNRAVVESITWIKENVNESV